MSVNGSCVYVISIYVCIYIYIYIYICVFMYVCTFVSIYVCTRVCMYICNDAICFTIYIGGFCNSDGTGYIILYVNSLPTLLIIL